MKVCGACACRPWARRSENIVTEPVLPSGPAQREVEIERMQELADLEIFGAIAPRQLGDVAVTPDPSKSHGVWEGWGTSLCWWANIFGTQDELADLCFTEKTVDLIGQKLPGLHMSIARYCLGGCSSKEVHSIRMVESMFIPPFKQIDGFWTDPATDPESWDWGADKNQTSMLVKAVERGVNYVELFCNSPMWWMTTSNNPSGSALGFTDNIAFNQYDNFCKYIATTAERFKRYHGVSFTSVDPFNEPSSIWWHSQGRQEGCHISKSAQRSILVTLANELKKRDLGGIALTASDECYYDEAISTFDHIITDPIVNHNLKKVNVHGYQYLGGRRDQLYERVNRAGKKLWNSEYGCGDGSGMLMAACIVCDFAWLHPTAWIYWQIIDEADGWGMLKADCRAETPALQRINNKHFVLAQFSRHIRPGMMIIDPGEEHMVAAYDSQSMRLVYVIVNMGSHTNISFDLKNFSVVEGPVTRWVTITHDHGDKYEQYRDVALAGKRFTLVLEESCVTTVEVEGVR